MGNRYSAVVAGASRSIFGENEEMDASGRSVAAMRQQLLSAAVASSIRPHTVDVQAPIGE
jgi:hypothetical protein